MQFDFDERTLTLKARVASFVREKVAPLEKTVEDELTKLGRWVPSPTIERLKAEARAEGLWNLFLPENEGGLSNFSYATVCEEMGRSLIAPEVFNCAAPDTGNMEVLLRYGTEAQKNRWLTPLLEGRMRSAFAMTEPAVASSDATNVESTIRREGDAYVLQGRKWWISGLAHPACGVLIFMGKTDPDNPDKHLQQSMVLVPRDTPGIRVMRTLSVFGYDDAPHGHVEVDFEQVRVPLDHLLLGEGRGFEIAQGRLGPGRIHHCMRLIGLAERALEAFCRRARSRVAFGKPLAEQTVTQERIAEARIRIEQCRLLTLHAAHVMDTQGGKAARMQIAMIKVAAPAMACQVIDWAMQAHGAAAMCEDFGLAGAYAQARWLRFADGPDEVHRNQIAQLELRQYA
jgi:acyl-CoA dehydrogenase